MNVEIRGRGLPLTETLKAHADSRLRCALSRFSTRIRAVRVLLEPGQGAETRCAVVVKLDSGDEVRVDDGSADVRFIIDHAADRAGRLVRRTLERERAAPSPGPRGHS